MESMTRATRLQFWIAAFVLLSWCSLGPAQSPGAYAPHPLLVGYFPQEGLHSAQPFYVKALVTNGAADRLDQINYSQGSVRNGRCSLADSDADLSVRFTRQNSVNGRSDNPISRFRGYFHQLEELKRRYPHLKMLISLEGDARDFAQDAQPENRKAFVASCVATFLRGHFAPGISKPKLFDGVDIDWESPQGKDAPNFLALIQEFRRQMNEVRPGLLLSVAVDESPQTFSGTDFANIAPLVDQVGVMNYDYAGPWSQTTGLLAPLFSNNPQDSHTIERSIASYEAAGVPAAKILMGLPFYGYSWTDVEIVNDGLFQKGNAIKQDRAYHHIRSIASNFSAHREEFSQEPWLFDGRTFWTYEDPVSIRFKASYAAHQHLGGLMIWELSGDTEDAELLSIAYRSLRDPLEENIFVKHARKRPLVTSVPTVRK
ncbi:MAG TPA: glycosyl hydrolase family 18 protein [Terracidiphilus sp.]|nr:glycosyl hydrolase family 18 protein [Terracidiphilus sp.]